jgi:hypothetical protein
MPVVFGVTIVLVNAVWAFLYWRREQTIIELGKLLASRTLAEYSWLKSAESGHRAPEPPKAESDENYESIWENDDGQR